MSVRETEGERMPHCTTNCECVSVSYCTDPCVCVRQCVCLSVRLICGFQTKLYFVALFFKHHQSKWFRRRLALVLHLGHSEEIPQSPDCWDTIAIKRQASAKKKGKKERKKENHPNSSTLTTFRMNRDRCVLLLPVSGWDREQTDDSQRTTD